MPLWSQWSLQDGMSPLMINLIEFHDYVMLVLVATTVWVMCGLTSLITNKLSSREMLDSQLIEGVWTTIPAVILLLLALPSLHLLYMSDELFNPLLTVKAVGHQWYWSYQYSDFSNISFDSYMLNTTNLRPGQYRLLDVDNRLILPHSSEIRVLVTGADVIHAWTVPSIGVKVDAVPGRLNQLGLNINATGVYYGQCSEICGANHSFMPIVLETISWGDFMSWIKSHTFATIETQN